MESDIVCGCCGVGDTCIWAFAFWCKKAKQKFSGDSRLCVQKPQELHAGGEVQFIWLLLFLAEQQCLAYNMDGKARGQMLLSSIPFILTAHINRLIGKSVSLSLKPNKPFESTYPCHSWLVWIYEALMQNFLSFWNLIEGSSELRNTFLTPFSVSTLFPGSSTLLFYFWVHLFSFSCLCYSI